MVEHCRLGEADRLALHARMESLSYRRIIGAMDTFFVAEGLLSEDESAALAAFREPALGWTWGDNHEGVAGAN